MADLAAARAAAPDGRVCGSFRAAQVQAPPPTLTRRLKWFLVALVLVVGQGLTAREALAQVRRASNRTQVEMVKSKATQQPKHTDQLYGVVVEQMPSFRGGSNREMVQYIQKQIIWPLKNGEMIQAEGKVFASFNVGADGRIRDPKIVKGLQPLFDAEVLRVLRAMPDFIPGRQNGKPTVVGMVVPITFKLE
ncbi:energy transducer TonB [Hymenobacter ruber]